MGDLQTTRALGGDDLDAVHALLEAAERARGFRPLSDQAWLDLVEGGREGFVAVLERDAGGSGLVAYAQVSRAHDSSTIESVVHPDHAAAAPELVPRLLTAALEAVAGEGGGEVHWWAFAATDDDDRIAADVGLERGRTLLQMRRPLPVPGPVVPTRPFEVGRDEQAWLAVNNRAFADHPEQGGWDLATLQLREKEPWFDPDGFLLHERDGRLAAFCWTKVHDTTEPMLGEIYVIAVDPDFHGLGLGRALTLAGLDHLHRRGITTAMLFVDAANVPAVSLYRRLGFTVHREDRAYTGRVTRAR